MHGRLNNPFEVQQVLGFYNDYHHFILKYSEKEKPLMRLKKKDERFECEAEQQLPFEITVTTFKAALLLRYPQHLSEPILWTDVSPYVYAAGLYQNDDRRVLHHMV